MALLRTVGTHVSEKMVGRGVIPFMLAAGALGVAHGLSDKSGPWRNSIVPDVQETLFGSSTAVQDSLSASIINSMSGMSNNDVHVPGNYYYGKPVNMQNRPTSPVDGSIVFGMFNLRR